MRTAPPLRVSPSWLLLAPLALACAGIRVETDRDPRTDLERYRTYAWLEEPLREQPRGPDSPRVDPFTHNSLLDQRLRDELDRRLRERGFERVARDEADFLVRYQVVTREEIDSNPGFVTGGYGRGYYGGALGAYGGVYTYRHGTLVVDFIDPESRRIAWRGWADRRSRGPHLDPDRLVAAVKYIVEEFPRGEE